MMPVGRPQFQVIVGATATERRLVTPAIVRALSGIPESVTDATLNPMIDAVLAQCARSLNMATYRAYPPTMARESVRATWLTNSWYWPSGWSSPYYYGYGLQPSTILLPWRSPITDIEIAEGETDLVENTDFRLLGAGMVERINGCWPTAGDIVVDYVAGFVPLSDDPSYGYDGETLPADIVQMIADQVRMTNDGVSIDRNLRSEDIPGVWSGTYNVAGGDAIDTSGLMRPLYDALSPYRAPPAIG
jgi:hypothetical protein